VAYTRSYYWRAVRSLARDQGITVSEARRQNWRAYAEAERERRADASARAATTRRQRERERESERGRGPSEEWIVEEPIEEVGGFHYQ